MGIIRDFISKYYVEAILGLAVLLIIIFVLLIIAFKKIKSSKERYTSFMRGLTGINIEDLLIRIDRDLKGIERDINLIEKDLNSLDTKLAFAIQKIGFIRYNAFDGIGSELSYSIALLDNFQNGFVITSIYGRECSVNYAKPLKDGVCKIPLSAEEYIAIERAVRGENQIKSMN